MAVGKALPSRRVATRSRRDLHRIFTILSYACSSYVATLGNCWTMPFEQWGVLVSLNRTRETILAFITDVRNRGPFGRHFASDVILNAESTNGAIAGREAVEGRIRKFLEQTFDAHPEIKLTLINDNQVILEADLVGSHQGEFRGIAATGRKIRIPCGMIFDLREGEITALRGHINLDQLLQQIR
jgi:predicted ester cyclase